MCLDVACGSGRDLCWLLWHEAQQRSLDPHAAALPWRGVGIDCAAGALTRAQRLAEQLGVADRAQLRRARINQQTGAWHQSGSKTDGGSEAAAVDAKAAPPADAASVTAASVPSASPPSVSALKPSQQQRREKRKKKEALRAAAAASAASLSSDPDDAAAVSSSSSSSSSLLPSCSFDLIVCVRFLCRSFIRTQLSRLLRPGGYFLLSTFIDDGVTVFAQPANPQFRIAGKDELERMAKEAGMELVRNRIGRAEDGRPLSECIMRKPMNHCS